jgi:hypothetical protein
MSEKVNEQKLPSEGQFITEGMGRYRVISRMGGALLHVESATGVTLTINWNNSGYRDARNQWRVEV